MSTNTVHEDAIRMHAIDVEAQEEKGKDSNGKEVLQDNSHAIATDRGEEEPQSARNDNNLTSCKTQEKDKEKKLQTRNFFLMKKIIDDPDVDGSLMLVGTFVQYVFGLTEEEAKRAGGFSFEYRFNEKCATDETLQKRRAESLRSISDKVFVSRTTFQASIPLEMDVPFTAFPFHVATATAAVELSSTFEGDQTIRPDLVLHKDDPRQNFSIQSLGPSSMHSMLFGQDSSTPNSTIEQQILEKIDASKKFDFVSPYPKLHFVYDTEKKYCSRFVMTFYCSTAGFMKFLSIILPIFLISVVATINVANEWISPDAKGSEVTGHLEVTSALTLAAVFILPQIIESSSNQHSTLNLDSFYVIIIFVSLVLTSFPKRIATTFAVETIGVVLLWLSFLIPISGWFRYRNIIRKIQTETQLMTKRNRFLRDAQCKKESKGELEEFFTMDHFLKQETNDVYGVDENEMRHHTGRYQYLWYKTNKDQQKCNFRNSYL